MNDKIRFLEIMLSDMVSHRDTLEMELTRLLNEENVPIIHKKIDFDKTLDDIVLTNNKIKTLSEYMTSVGQISDVDNNN
jgi:hypothetical protein|tara:strand:- start:244 stop:480 length:237 start_codon:yes stop_codon:yes gene_type:complete